MKQNSNNTNLLLKKYKINELQPQPGDIVEYKESYNSPPLLGYYKQIKDEKLHQVWAFADKSIAITVIAWRWPGEKEWRQ